MTRTVVLPSRESQSADSVASEATVHYVEDWFEYEQFDRAFSVLLDFGEEVPDDSPWKAENVDFWRIWLRSFFLQGHGNFKYLYPIVSGVSEVLENSTDEVVFVWPTRDVVTTLVGQLTTDHASGELLSVRVDSEHLNPIPNVYHGDDLADEDRTNGVFLYLKSFFYLSVIHVLLLAGQLLPRNECDGKNLIYAHPTNRELTEKMLQGDSIVVSLLHPKLVPVIRSLLNSNVLEGRRRIAEAMSDQVSAEDVFTGRLLTLAPYRTMYRLLRTRQDLETGLQQYLSEHQFSGMPDGYFLRSFDEAFDKPASFKYIVYAPLFEEISGLSTLTSVSGGEDQEFLYEMGEKYDIKTVDLNHSVLMNDPPEIRSRADIIAAKGTPDTERLERQNLPGRLVLTGRPYNDELYRLLDAEQPAELPSIFSKGEQTLLVATEPIRDEHIVRVIQQAFNSDRANSICIKLHPKESISHYESLLGEVNTGDMTYSLVFDEYNLFDLIRASDVVVTGSSNVGLEALVLGVPGVHVTVPPNVELYYQTVPYFDRFMTDVDDAADTIDQFLQDGLNPGSADEIREMYRVDGQSSSRILEKVYDA